MDYPMLITALGGAVAAVGGIAVTLYTVISKNRRYAVGDYARTIGFLARLRIWISKQGVWLDVPDELRDAIDRELDE